jgi:hypothetical protein
MFTEFLSRFIQSDASANIVRVYDNISLNYMALITRFDRGLYAFNF